MSKKISILLAIHNGSKWLEPVLDSIKKQTYSHEQIEILILDNASSDNTKEVVSKELATFNFQLLTSEINLGFWPGFENLLTQSHGEYVIACTDVVLDQYFIERAVTKMDQDKKIGALQAKILQPDKKTIDTCGFRINRARRVTNIGHGQEDRGQYDNPPAGGEIFAVEGAVPVFRRSALEDTRINGTIIDHDYFWYGDDLDLAWRMNLLGWRQIFAPEVIAYHDRSTTKGVSHSILGHINRIKFRRQIPLQKRRLDWSNVRFTIIKNDYIINVLRDLPWILAREIAVFGYTLLFEPTVFLEVGRFFKLLPKMIAQRRAIMAKAKVSADAMHEWYEF